MDEFVPKEAVGGMDPLDISETLMFRRRWMEVC